MAATRGEPLNGPQYEPSRVIHERVWRSSGVLLGLYTLPALALAAIALDVALGAVRAGGASIEDVLVLGCLLLMGVPVGSVLLRRRCRLDADGLWVRNWFRTWHLPLADVVRAAPNETGCTEVTDVHGQTRVIGVASCFLPEALLGVDQRSELLDALEARGITVQRG